jgi:cytochrome c553
MKPHNLQTSLIAAAVLVAATFAPLAFAEAKKAKYTVKEVMKEIHKGEDNIGKRVAKGQASKEDIAKLVDYYAALPLNEPPRGEKESWMAKTAALVKASEEIKLGKAGALDHYKAASNCKACHEAHKPESKEKK